jgi:hypothetical protein
MEAEDWLKGIEKKLMISRCMDCENVLFTAHQLFGTTSNWWEIYCNTYADVDSITWNEFQTHFHTHHLPPQYYEAEQEGAPFPHVSIGTHTCVYACQRACCVLVQGKSRGE